MSARAVENGSGDGIPKKKTVEDIYQKKSQLEHILLRPDTYIGSIESVNELMWVYDSEKQIINQQVIKYVPGLYKIFDEILVNAADNKQNDPNTSTIKIDIDAESNTISVWNNGRGVPVTMHKEEKMYVPTLIFGHLLTSSNYNDEEKKVTGGRNGYGAKLCNIFSHRFTIETASKEYKKCLKQTWGNNMEKVSEPKIKDFSGSDFTKVTFSPDLTKFGMESLDKDIVALMSRRAYDVAASTRGVAVYLNGVKIPVKNFKDYIELYVKDKKDESDNPLKIHYETCGPRWEVGITLSNDGFQQMSFVNSIATTKGGRHVDHVVDLIVKQLTDVLKKKNKIGVAITPAQIKNHLWIFVNCLIDNPTFDSQTKENMTLQSKKFGSKCAFGPKFTQNVTKIGIVDAILSTAQEKADKKLDKLGSKSKKARLKGISKLVDANQAGKARSFECTLILTEGDSAKAMVISGLSSAERDIYGVYPLRGKLLNVREANSDQLSKNAEITELIRALGLQYGMKYETIADLKKLRYGKMMIMTDQDQDGSHIKGLIINFIHYKWPSLLKLNFIEEFITPIVKATKRNQQLSFFSIPEFEIWKKQTDNYHTYNIKYYKGLGTSTASEAKEYFKNMVRHKIKFKYSGEQDDQNIIMAFSKKYTDQRKDWLTNHMEETKRRNELDLGERYLYEKDTHAITYSQFINLELVLFSNYDNVRSIPNAIDGFKPGQRKVIFTCFKRNDKREVKVAQLAGSVAEHSAYHHGEVSLMTTIVNLAQNFVGSNNINLLQPIGQFGTRLTGGKDSASPRYIFTMPSPLARLIFNKNDEPLLKYEYDDNQRVEPIYYMPIIPMILVNGADGIGTGWMTKIPNYNPREIIDNLIRLMDGAEPKPMIPYYKNFKGSIEAYGDYRYVISGEISIIGPNEVEITELPVGTWTQTYKESVLEPMLHGSEKGPPTITDYKEYNTDTEVRFIVTLIPNKLQELEKDGLHKVFKLQTTLSITSMCAFDENRCLKKYDNAMQIMQSYYKVRLEYYNKRKNYLVGNLLAESSRLSNQARFILEKCDGTLVIENKKKKDMIAELVSRKYDSDPVAAWKLAQNKESALEEMTENAEDETVTAASLEKENYDYLLGMAMWVLTKERKDELLRQRDEKIAELNRLKVRTPISLWKEDLENLLIELNKIEEKEKKEEEKNKKEEGKNKKPLKGLYKANDTRRIAPSIDTELKKKIERADILSKDRHDGIKKQPKVKKEVIEEKDEFDALVESNAKTLEDRIGNSPDKITKKIASKKGMKQTILSFKPVRKEKAGGKVKEEEPTKEIDFESISPSPTRPARRKAATKARYVISDEESDNSAKHSDHLNSDVELKVVKKDNNSSDSDAFFEVDKKAPPPRVSSEDLFDSLIGNTNKAKESQPVLISSSEDSLVKSSPPKKVIAKRKTENGGGKNVKKQRKKTSSGSDSDTLFDKLNAVKKKQKLQSDSDKTNDESPASRKNVGRARKMVSYAISDDSDD